MDVRDGLHRQFVQRLRRVLAEVDVVGVQVGHVDQQPHPGPLDQLRQELPLGELLVGPGDQRGDVLQGERHRQRVLRDPHVLAEHVQRVPGAGHRQQVPRLQPRRRGQRPPGPHERDVLGHQGRPQQFGARRESGEPVGVGPVRAAEAERHPVRHDGHPALAQPYQRVREVVGAEVLRDRLHPVDPAQRLHLGRDLRPPADTDAQFHAAPVPLLTSFCSGSWLPSRGDEPDRWDVQSFI